MKEEELPLPTLIHFYSFEFLLHKQNNNNKKKIFDQETIALFFIPTELRKRLSFKITCHCVKTRQFDAIMKFLCRRDRMT